MQDGRLLGRPSFSFPTAHLFRGRLTSASRSSTGHQFGQWLAMHPGKGGRDFFHHLRNRQSGRAFLSTRRTANTRVGTHR